MKTVSLFIIGLFLSIGLFSQSTGLSSVLPAEFYKGIKNNNTVLDCRTPQEFAESHIKGAININFYDSKFYSDVEQKTDKSEPLYIYCRSGNRSMHASKALVKMGFKQVYNLHGGKNLWLSQGYKMIH